MNEPKKKQYVSMLDLKKKSTFMTNSIGVVAFLEVS